ncbi:flavodoxin family protein [Gemelliphila palaticanis]|uniref:Flavodoxin domain-containing protein n=1 Tax=Gemelliphila palaticanis TaxID=81950 RepID=A0ABX2T190_9BACL|nr:flavodoxin family protein [Gemella palaticanis]MBF0716208.1 flavodoxin domain-containing protein [Gemella palaticanis]NYS48138.1 flavodoxin domain-containing protein [Gemella palaticanis]
MKILIAYSSKTKNTKKVAEAIFFELKNNFEVDLIDIKKYKNKRIESYDLYILGCWVDKATLNKNMMMFIEDNNINNKKVALFMTCGVPDTHYHAEDSINNYISYMKNKNNDVLSSFICQGKIDPKILIVFKFLTWRDPNFIHKIDKTILEWVESSKTHPNIEDLRNAKKWALNTVYKF